jgi:predicted CXXCH cytochrome family protein
VKPLSLFVGVALMTASMAGVAYTPGAGITGTPHDWSGVNATKLLQWVDSKGNVTTYDTGIAFIDPATGKQGVTTVTIGQCTKCHTPHQAKSTNLLWNHTLQAITYQWNVPETTAGMPYAKFQGDTNKARRPSA